MLCELFRIGLSLLSFVSRNLAANSKLFHVLVSRVFDRKECSNFVRESSPVAITAVVSASVTLQVCAQLTYLNVVDGN
jgi:hypothetical protein